MEVSNLVRGIRDLLSDRIVFNSVMSSEEKKTKNQKLKKEFKLAVKFVLATEGTDPRVTQLVQLSFYKYFKQATIGKCKETAPSIFSPIARLKWEAWNRLGKMKKKKAMKEYIKCLTKLEPDWKNPEWVPPKLKAKL